MKSYIITTILAAATAVMAVPAIPKRDVCGPNSNCEFKEVDGEMTYVFKEGMGPDSSDYEKRFVDRPAGSLARRGEVVTDVLISKSKMEWGCWASVYNAVANTIETKCKTSQCDTLDPGKFSVQYTQNGRGMPIERELSIQVDGKYPADSKDKLKQAILSAITHDTTEEKTVWWGSGNRINGGGACPMKLFSKSVSVARFEDGSLKDNMKFIASLGNSENFCMASQMLTAIGGAISGIAGGFFGLVSATCT